MLDLGHLQDHIHALQKGDGVARRQAIRSLKDYKDCEWAAVSHKVIQPLVELLQDSLSGDVKQTAIHQDVVTILGNIGPRAERAIPQLIEFLRAGNPAGMQEAAAMALGKCGRIGSADEICVALSNLWMAPGQNQNTQVRVASALCKLRIEANGILRFLTSNVMASPDASHRRSAVEALASCSKNEIDVVPALLAAALHDKDEEVRQAAEASLAELHLTREKAMRVCAQQLKESSYAETALRNAGQLGVAALTEALDVEDAITREKAARTLGCLREEAREAVPALRAVLRDKDLNVRLAAAKALWNVSNDAEIVAPVLVDLLEKHGAAGAGATESRRRNLQNVIEALQRVGPPAEVAVPALMKLTTDANRLIRESALRAVKTIVPTIAPHTGMR
jgi:HEAT repeat protein